MSNLLPAPTEARALWVTGPRRAELRAEALPAPGPGDVCVSTRFTGISRGTERLVLEGRVPEDQHAAMRAPHQGGTFPFPVKYGYANVGEVVSGALPTGTRVFCLYPHQDRYVVPVGAVVVVPEAVPSERAILAANLETAVNAVWDGRVGPGDAVAVVGGGVVGAAIAWLCGRVPGTEVQLVDVLPERRDLARALGVGFAVPGEARRDRDVVFHTSATAPGLATALALAGAEAQVLEVSWYGEGTVAAPLGGAFHSRRLTLRGSQVGGLPVDRRPRWTYRRRLEVALALLADPALDALIDGESTFDALPEALLRVTRSSGGPLCHRVRYR